ncbi:Aspartyl/glutamyl-tRNA(Asn/Gln) amidotransferase subunit B [bacterium HR33]|nr:Aspartyl/glutamyl-tRNA(Asn/Gln) amidotransferase subunit B [bacterium HR33]
MSWQTVIGLEIHVQLRTRSKLFCACSANFGDPPNTNVCPVCLGLPGALPVPNEGAIRLAVRAALGLGCTVHRVSLFARKNYFYPDLPKGYQISQFEEPLATGGFLEIDGRRIGIARLHLEEDAGKSLHDRFPDLTALDFNRCGVPLIEIVTRPDLRSPEEGRAFLTSLKRLLEYLEVSDCNMEEGSLRVDANLSVRKPGQPLGVKQEVKNLNSFAAVERALGELRDLQVRTLEAGEELALTTYTARTGELKAMRAKEESQDYRYFPEPDLPPLDLAAYGIDPEEERRLLPELPQARQARFERVYGLSAYDSGVLTATRQIADYYEALVESGIDAKEAANWVMGPVLADANLHGGRLRIPPNRMAELILFVARGGISQQAAKRMLPHLAETDQPVALLAETLGLVQVRDRDLLDRWVNETLQSHPGEVQRFRAGEARLLAFFMGEVMKLSKGRADPKLAREVLLERLSLKE